MLLSAAMTLQRWPGGQPATVAHLGHDAAAHALPAALAVAAAVAAEALVAGAHQHLWAGTMLRGVLSERKWLKARERLAQNKRLVIGQPGARNAVRLVCCTTPGWFETPLVRTQLLCRCWQLNPHLHGRKSSRRANSEEVWGGSEWLASCTTATGGCDGSCASRLAARPIARGRHGCGDMVARLA